MAKILDSLPVAGAVSAAERGTKAQKRAPFAADTAAASQSMDALKRALSERNAPIQGSVSQTLEDMVRDDRYHVDEFPTARTLNGVTTELQNATRALAGLSVAYADAVERRGDEIDAMLAQIRSTMATATA